MAVNKHKIKSLNIYNIALELSVEIYIITKSFPEDEKFGITSQLRRSSSSVGANIAEGYNRRTIKNQIQFYHQAKGSITETIYFLELSFNLNYVREEKCKELINGYVQLDIKTYNYINSLTRDTSKTI